MIVINYPAARLVGEPFDPESFDPELMTEGLMTEGLMTEGFMTEGLKSSRCGVLNPNIFIKLVDGAERPIWLIDTGIADICLVQIDPSPASSPPLLRE